ncbi:MAG: hypothetical protein Fur0037_09050 [Planctomycetota bacterium]
MERPPRNRWRALAVPALALAASALALPWNLGVFAGGAEFRAGLGRVVDFAASLRRPDTSEEMLARVAALAVETLAVALLGVALGLLIAWPLSLGASRSVALGASKSQRPPGRALLQTSRFALDVLRGVPDFVWALLFSVATGPNAVAGTLAIGASVGGILGKVLSEQWDNVRPERYQALWSCGASRLCAFLYGIQPLAARHALSFVLMRTECAIRNATVIGVVGGGGLGTALWDEFTNEDSHAAMARMATVLLAMLTLTAATDVLANLLRRHLRVDTSHPRGAGDSSVRATNKRRWTAVLSAGAILGTLAWQLRGPLARASEGSVDWGFAASYFGGLAIPDLSPPTLLSALSEARIPLALGVIATAAAVLAAAVLALPASVSFQLEPHRHTGARRGLPVIAAAWVLVACTRGLCLVLRGIPEVAWVLVLSIFFRQGITPCALAIALHGTGVLARVFTEAVDDIPHERLGRVPGSRAAQTYLYAAIPSAWPTWKTYSFFQFEVNVRTGVVLGWVGAGGLGDKFDSNRQWLHLHEASTYLWSMILLTVAIDRLSRRLQLRRIRC